MEDGAGARLRAAELARTAGISAQQVRNYEDEGLLPPAERTPGGHRVFTRVHAEALATARALAAGYGWRTARAVMGAVHGGDVDGALAALDAGHAALHRERSGLAAVREAVESVVARRPGPAGAPRRGGVRIGRAAAIVGVRPPVLRLWEERGLLRPAREEGTGYRLYGEAEVRAAHVVALLRRGGHRLDAIRPVVDALRATGSPERVRDELAAREEEVNRRGLRCLAASAALYGYLRHTGRAAPVTAP
ncbi:MerR family transcriptional regulator [Streptomyces sp. URMC 125]|uniref:MerR family transcriptional regulator n=1 Tax=Streptomyces sp. URMC 125 TaxID=3423419 RepID=UPI003F1AE587